MTTDGINLSDRRIIRTRNIKDRYKYLGVFAHDSLNQQEAKGKNRENKINTGKQNETIEINDRVGFMKIKILRTLPKLYKRKT